MRRAFCTNKVREKKKKRKPQTHLLERRICNDVRGLEMWAFEMVGKINIEADRERVRWRERVKRR